MHQIQEVLNEIETAVLQQAGCVLNKMEKRCKETAILRLAIFGTQTARSLLVLHDARLATTSEGVRRILFETWTLMWSLLDVDDGTKLGKWFDNPSEALREKSDKVRKKLEAYISSQACREWPEFKKYYDEASVLGIHPSYISTTNAMAEATARLGYADDRTGATLATQRSAAFDNFQFQLYFLFSLVVAVFDKSPELKSRKVPLEKTRGWIKQWEAENPVAENVVETVAETNTRSA